MNVTPKLAMIALVYLLLLGVGIFYTVISVQQTQDNQNCRNARTVDKPLGYNPDAMILFGLMAMAFAVGMPAFTYFDSIKTVGAFDIDNFAKWAPIFGLESVLLLPVILGLYYLIAALVREKTPQVCPEVAEKYDTHGWNFVVFSMPIAILVALSGCFLALMFM